MVEHLRVLVFDNGRYLRSKKLTSPNGGQIDPTLLQIRQVRQELLIKIDYSQNKAKLLPCLVPYLVPLKLYAQ